jgi:DNA-binding GntR family transcriptional regulator
MKGKKQLRAVQKAAPSPERSPETFSIALQIAEKIEEDVVLGRRHPRERLIEQDLSNDFETHRGDVRLALFELEKKGIVERIPNRGAIVRDLTPAEVREVYAVREELEVMAVRILPMPVAKEDLKKIDLIRRDHSRAVAAHDLLAVYHKNIEFHRSLYGLCGNTCLIETIERLAQKVSVIRSWAHANPDALNRARLDHARMIEALKQSRREDLISLTRMHLKPAPNAYIESYEKRFRS